MMIGYSLGIDTSCYTTSFAVVSLTGKVIYNSQILLDVEKGERGLRQSNAIFKHLKNVPQITHELGTIIDPQRIVVLSSTVRPRPIEDSYMPVFLVGETVGRTISDFLNVPFYPTSHQECHIAAGRYSAQGPVGDSFLAIHFSGGTSELLKVNISGAGYDLELLGSTQDLHAGQFVDRMGVLMGLNFPAGAQLEQLATFGQDHKISIPVFVRNMTIGFSGAEAHTKRLLQGENRREDIAIAIYNCLADTLYKWISNAIAKTGLTNILLVGGVTSSHMLREKLTFQFKHRPEVQLFFADPKLARDNAVGAALLGAQYYKEEEEHGGLHN